MVEDREGKVKLYLRSEENCLDLQSLLVPFTQFLARGVLNQHSEPSFLLGFGM